MAESFFATLECELLDRTKLRTHAEAEAAVIDFIEAWYNPHRRHSSLGYQSPNNFERTREGGVPTDRTPRRSSTQGQPGASPSGNLAPSELARREVPESAKPST